MYKLAIIIINYNSPKDTLACLQSVEKFALDMQPHILLYDNSDKKPINEGQLAQLKLNIKFQQNVDNIGFSGAVNQALMFLRDSDYTHFFLLNNDVVLVDNSLHKMMHYLKKNQKVQIVGGVNYYYNNPEKVWQAGFRNNWCTGNVTHIPPEKDAAEVDYVPGSTLLGKISLIRKIGLMDEQFFHYFEENDYCMRAAPIGKVMVLGGTRFLHKVDKRDRKDSPFVFYYMTRNYLLFIKKHRAPGKRVLSTIYFLIYNFFRAVKYDIIGMEQPAFTFMRIYQKAIWHYYKGIKGKYNTIHK